MFKTEDNMNEHLPLRVILRPKDGGGWEGLIEHSFAMGWDSHRALVYWSGTAYSILGEQKLDAAQSAADSLPYYPGAQAFDPMSPDCPVTFDLTSWLHAESKFDRRNAFFENRA